MKQPMNVDLTELKELRRAQLSYFDAEDLIDIQSELRQQRGEEPITWSAESLAETLTELYPSVLFARGECGSNQPPQYAPVIAEVRPEFAGDLRTALGLTFFVPEDFEGVIYTDEDGVRGILQLEDERVVFCPDGFGYIADNGYYDFFSHDLDVAKLTTQIKGNEREIADQLREHFYESVNENLDDPYIDANELDDQPVHFTRGSEEELRRLVELFILTEPEIAEQAGNYVRIRTATEQDDAQLDDDNDSYFSERLDALMDLALNEHQPEGWSHEYNDGPVNQASGWSLYSESITYRIDDILELPARVQMAARYDLKEWLEKRGHLIEAFDTEPFTTAPAATAVGGSVAPAREETFGESLSTTDSPAPEEEEAAQEEEEVEVPPLFPVIKAKLYRSLTTPTATTTTTHD